jgi:beta-glucanase (GH16 family)
MSDSTANVRQDGHGHLKITPIRDAAGHWTSGRIETNRADLQPPAFGKLRIEARLQLPDVTGIGALGYWPAVWMLGAPFRGNFWNWPSVGEIDIMENARGINANWAALHCGTSPGGPCNEWTGLSKVGWCHGLLCTKAFHRYTFEWDRTTSPQQMRWYLDDVLFHTVRSTDVPPQTWAEATSHGYFLIVDLAMGGSFTNAFGGGPNASTVSGKSMLVDYVAAWTWVPPDAPH